MDQMIIYLVFTVSVGIESLNPILYKWLIDKMQANDFIIQSIWFYGLGCVLLKLLEWGLYYPIYLKQRGLSFDLSAEHLLILNKKAMAFSAQWHQTNHSGATINRIKKSYEAIKGFMLNDFLYLRIFFRIIFAIVALMYFTPSYWIVCLLLGGMTFYFISISNKKFLNHLTEVNEKDHDMTSSMSDNLINHKTLISLHLTASASEKLKDRLFAIKRPFMASFKVDALKWSLVDVFIVLIHAIVVIGYVYQNHAVGEVFIIGGLVAVITYLAQFTGAIHDLAWLYTTLTQTYSDFKASDIILYSNEQENDVPVETPSDAWNNMVFTNINYVHPNQNGEQTAGLFDIDLEFHKGQKVVLIGKSGSGKTTLLNLFGGLNKSNSAKVLLDGKDIKWETFHKMNTLWLQHPEIFNETLLYNLNMGKHFSDEQIKEACNLAGIDKLLKKMPKGLFTKMDQAGSNLSGGERQLISIARGILLSKDSQILLFDEPTSSMDMQTEECVVQNIFQHFQDKTIICSLHRYYLLHHFDYIYIMEKGKIVWNGTYETLISEKMISHLFEETA